MLKRVGRYLIGHGRMVQSFPFGHDHEMVIGYGDSDWAGCKTDRKSTSGGVLTWGGHVVKTWSSTQQTLSLSSGEAELYALTKTACQTLGAMQLLKDLGIKARGMVLSDSNAAIGMVQREGLGGRTRHIQVQSLWIQERVAREELKMKKVDTKKKPSDLMTKFLGKDDKDKMLKIMRMRTVKEKDANARRCLRGLQHKACSRGGVKESAEAKHEVGVASSRHLGLMTPPVCRSLSLPPCSGLAGPGPPVRAGNIAGPAGWLAGRRPLCGLLG